MELLTLGGLPPEIRCIIFSFLLSGKEVRDSTDPFHETFEFDTAILSVNKDIGKEAEHYLRSVNTFVLITYPVSLLGSEIENAFLPIISHDVAAESFAQPNMSISVSGRKSTGFFDGSAVLILGEDLPIFCRDVLQRRSHITPCGQIYILSAPKLRPIETSLVHVKDYPSVAVNISGPTRHNLTSDEIVDYQQNLLSPLTCCTVRARSISFAGISEDMAAALVTKVLCHLLFVE